MTEKRFISEDDCHGYYTEIIDNEKELDLSLYNPKKNLTVEELVDFMNALHEENQLLKEEKELLKNKLDRIEDILPHYLSCAEISEFRGKTVKEDIALMKCWNKRGIKND